MKRVLRNVLATFLVLILSTHALMSVAEERGPSTAEEREKAVKLARYLEREPLGKQAKDARTWLVLWWASIPDMTVSLCSEFFGPFSASKHKYASEIITQMMFSSGAYLIETGQSASDPVSVHLAGLEGALRSYEALAKDKQKLKDRFLDDLVTKRNEGSLRAYVETVMPKCK